MAQASAPDGGGRSPPDLSGLTLRPDIFAEYLACGFTVRETSDALGIPPKHGDFILTRMRRALGWQAV